MVALFAAYVIHSYRATGFDRRILRNDERVTVADTADTITFTPTGSPRRSALIFIPGSMVDPDAYAPLARKIADDGHPVIVAKLPWRLASTDAARDAVVERVRAVIDSSGGRTRWVVAGHSFGGALAARVARDHANKLAGVVLIGTSHPRDFDLSRLTIDVTKVSASNDGLASPAEVKANARKLPPHTRWVTIDGGNHSQFGYYGFQLGDRRATISRDAQQEATRQALSDTLNRADR